MLPDYYSILNIPSSATSEKIRASYRRLAKLRHPDAGGSSDDFRSLQEAYEVLSDPARRRDYDAQRRPRRGSKTRSFASPLSPAWTAAPGDPVIEPLIPPQPRESLRGTRFTTASAEAVPQPGAPADFDRLFREFDEFFEQLEEQLLESYWGRSE